MALQAVITTIQRPTQSVRELVARLSRHGARLVVAGDSKGPDSFDGPEGTDWPVDFLPLSEQESGRFLLAKDLPKKHYARKNIAYLHAIGSGASCLYETDDDNAPIDAWSPRKEMVESGRVIEASGWANVYRCFSPDLIWPRGLPLDEIRKPAPSSSALPGPVRAPIQQGLVNGSADVDAIWRLVMDREFFFEERESVLLSPGVWCPFNTQTTWWWPVVYPLLYIPSNCSFRMCDIWKSFVAQRCLWELGFGVVFHAPEVYQDRNIHDLTRDFEDEVPGYRENRRLCDVLSRTPLLSGESEVAANLVRCYEALVRESILPEKELVLVRLWIEDLDRLTPR